MDKTDYSRVCYNTKCSKHMKGNQCWYNESAISDCEGRIKADRRKSARKYTNFDRIRQMSLDELAEYLTKMPSHTDTSQMKAWLESELSEALEVK